MTFHLRKKQTWLPVLALLAISPAVSAAQAIKSFPADTLKEAGRVFAAPFTLSTDGAELAGALAAAGLLAYSQDSQIRRIAFKNRSSSSDGLSKNLEKLGNGGYDAILLLAYGGAGRLAGNVYMEDTAVLAAESFLAANAAGTVLKYAVGRYRPYTDGGKARFVPFNFKTAGTSFPSGHTVSAFSVASVFAARADCAWIKVLAYSLASGVALQRVYADKHWASDVLAGAAIGTLVGRDVARGAGKGSALTLLPSPAGLTLALKF